MRGGGWWYVCMFLAVAFVDTVYTVYTVYNVLCARASEPFIALSDPCLILSGPQSMDGP